MFLKKILIKFLQDDFGHDSSKRLGMLIIISIIFVYAYVGLYACVFSPLKDSVTFVKLLDALLISFVAIAGTTAVEKFKRG